MNSYIKPVEIRWADLDPNFHVRHSVYYDCGAYCRLCYLDEHGITSAVLRQNLIGPILLREEAVFRKEIHFGDQLSIDLQLVRSRKDYTRWSIRHQLIKNNDIIAAVITVDGAWIDTDRRRLATPPPFISEAFDLMPKSPDFEWINK